MRIDILDYFRGARPWSQMRRLIAQLPAHSRYKAAIHDDDDFARIVLAQRGDKEPGAPTMAGYTPVVQAVHDLTDWVKSLYALTVAVHTNGSAPKLPPTPRPRTAFDRVARGRLMARHRARVALMLPNKE